jgi:2-polyprenyl-3-methyl-5-hydroxy-6-metoxy-1,4-benzoquinol methylase
MPTAAPIGLQRHALGFYEIAPRPSSEELETYYATQYHQRYGGHADASAHTPEELAWMLQGIERKARVALELLPALPPSPRLLDVGCGEGFVLDYFGERGWLVTGMDCSRAGLERENPQCLPDFREGRLESLLEDGARAGERYALIWLDNVLEHVREPLALLERLRSLLEPGGLVVIEVPNDFSRLQGLLRERGHVDRDYWVRPPDHLNYFDSESLKRACLHCGLSVRRILADFPIEWFLLHPGSNYVFSGENGPACHRARIALDNFMHRLSPEKTNTLYEALGALGMGRQITAFARARVEGL